MEKSKEDKETSENSKTQDENCENGKKMRELWMKYGS